MRSRLKQLAATLRCSRLHLCQQAHPALSISTEPNKIGEVATHAPSAPLGYAVNIFTVRAAGAPLRWDGWKRFRTKNSLKIKNAEVNCFDTGSVLLSVPRTPSMILMISEAASRIFSAAPASTGLVQPRFVHESLPAEPTRSALVLLAIFLAVKFGAPNYGSYLNYSSPNGSVVMNPASR